MPFRLKTILGVAIIQAVLLAGLVWISLDVLGRSNEDRLIEHAATTATLFATTAKAPVLATDLATLESFVHEVLKNPGLVYARVIGRRGVLAEAGDPKVLARPFVADSDLAGVRDGVFDSEANIGEGGVGYGRVEIGFSTERISEIIDEARRQTITIAVAEMLLVALFSMALGFYLTRQLEELTRGADGIAAGKLGLQVPVRGRDELARTALAFNNMSAMLKDGRERRRVLLETALDCILEFDASGEIVALAPDEVFGYRSRDLIGKQVSPDLIPEADFKPIREAIAAYLDSGILDLAGRRLEVRLKRADGSGLLAELFMKLGFSAGGRRVIAYLRDITERKRAEEGLRLAASVFGHASEGIMITDPDGHILDANQAFTEITGYAKAELIGETPRLFKSGHHTPGFYRSMWSALKEQGAWSGEISNRKKSGEGYIAKVTISSVSDAGGETRQFVALYIDITATKEYQKRLEHLAHHDALTGLPNRVLLRDRMEQAIARTRRAETLLAVAYLDLDGFKPVNDALGHEAGDRLLKGMADRLLGCIRAGDTVARLGGDEFVLLLNDLRCIDECESALTRILQEICRPFEIQDRGVQVFGSIGLTVYPLDAAAPDTLLRHADQAMYSAKQAGRNRFHLFDGSVVGESGSRSDQ